MRIAAFADLHGHNFAEFDKRSTLTGSERLDKIVETLMYMKQYCIDNGIKYLLFAGDLFHIRAKVGTIVYNALYDAIKSFGEVGIQIVMIPGNHDQYDHSDVPQHSLHAFRDMKHVHVQDDMGIVNLTKGDHSNVSVVCIPYSKNVQRIKDYLEYLTTDPTHAGLYHGRSILLFHLGIAGGFVGSRNYPMAEAFTVEDLHPNFFHYAVGGHFHKHQFLGDHPHVFYCGAPIQHDFGDEGQDKGFFVIDTDKRYHVEFVPIPSPQFHTITDKDLDDVVDVVLKMWADAGDYVRVMISQSNLQRFMVACPQGLKYKLFLQKEFTQETRVDVKVGMGADEVISKYADEYNPEAKGIGLKILAEVEGER